MLTPDAEIAFNLIKMNKAVLAIFSLTVNARETMSMYCVFTVAFINNFVWLECRLITYIYLTQLRHMPPDQFVYLRFFNNVALNLLATLSQRCWWVALQFEKH